MFNKKSLVKAKPHFSLAECLKLICFCKHTFQIALFLVLNIFIGFSNQLVLAEETNSINSPIQSSHLGSKLAFLSKWKEKKKSSANNFNSSSKTSSKTKNIIQTNIQSSIHSNQSPGKVLNENNKIQKQSNEKRENIFDERSPEELIQETLGVLQTLPLSDSIKLSVKSYKLTPSLDKLRQGQLLVLNTRKAKNEIENIEYVIEYIENTRKCLNDISLCLQQSQDDEFMGSFYTWVTSKDIEIISSEINNLQSSSKDTNNFKRAKILYLATKSLNLGVQEIDGPNDDSKNGQNFISQFFKAAGLLNPGRELGSDKADNWAWCAAFATAIVNQAGFGFSFLSIDQYNQSCKEANKKFHCHPVQVDFILQWAKRNGLTNSLSNTKASIESLMPGDLLIMVNKKSDQASHMGFYLAKSIEMDQEGNNEKGNGIIYKSAQTELDDPPNSVAGGVQKTNLGNKRVWIYSIEGNAGPFINDKLENKWNEVLLLKADNKISGLDYERLLDRVTIVKRPIESWDYSVSQSD
ncbi:MAG: hypothetical protein ACK481_09080 [Candidatus Melainabacteria bacterium]